MNMEKERGHEELILHDDVRGKLRSWGILEKPDTQGYDMDKIIQKLDLPEELKTKLKKTRGKPRYHILRMAKRTGPEKEFAVAYLQYASDVVNEDVDNKREIYNVIGSENHNTMLFWTFAPYLLKNLKERGISDEEVIKKILSWSKDGLSCDVIDEHPEKYTGHMGYKGLEHLYDKEGWVLSEDPGHISHKFTDQEAKRIVNEILLSNEKNKDD